MMQQTLNRTESENKLDSDKVQKRQIKYLQVYDNWLKKYTEKNKNVYINFSAFKQCLAEWTVASTQTSS